MCKLNLSWVLFPFLSHHERMYEIISGFVSEIILCVFIGTNMIQGKGAEIKVNIYQFLDIFICNNPYLMSACHSHTRQFSGVDSRQTIRWNHGVLQVDIPFEPQQLSRKTDVCLLKHVFSCIETVLVIMGCCRQMQFD